VFQEVSLFDTIHFFEQLGVFPKNDAEGRMYPFSDQASAIHEILLSKLIQLGVEIQLESNVTQIKKEENQFHIVLDDKIIVCDCVIVCAGGRAYPNLGSNGSGYSLLQQQGHHITPIHPSLVGLKVKESTKHLGGIRVKGTVTLKSNNTILGNEDGEVQLRETGVSGIVMMQMSVIIARRKVQGYKEPYQVSIDLMPTLQISDVYSLIKDRVSSLKSKTIGEYFIGMFHPQLGKDMLNRIGIYDHGKQVQTMTSSQIEKIANIVKNYTFEVIDFYPFEDAQVCSGGVMNHEFYPTTLESKLVKGLYVAGEVMNVDGETGGFNLQWAWSSGLLAGKMAATADL
jgi:predicted Rossmann fold flavoprotein